MELDDDELDCLITEVKDYQITHGSLLKQVKFETPTTVSARPVGVSLLPTPFDREYFNQAKALQSDFNELYIRAACDVQWLQQALEPVLQQDDLVRALWDIHKAASENNSCQSDVACGIFRSDYMIHTTSKPGLRQVEMNTFSVAGICHAEKVAEMHHYLARTRGLQYNLPTSGNIAAIVLALSQAHHLYEPTTRRRCGLLMIVQAVNFNVADERPIEYGLWDKDVPCYRCDWHDVPQRSWKKKDGTLMFLPPSGNIEVEISVVYYRAGYEAAEYDQDGKQIRLEIETSRAIQCPDVLTQLTTFKTVQQAMTQAGAVERFLQPKQVDSVRSTFMPMHVLHETNHWARDQAMNLEDAAGYVLKPNLEGGGHNVYGQNIVEFLKTQPQHEWGKYTLMKKIEPPNISGTLLTSSKVYQGAVVCELGFLGTCLWRREAPDGAQILNNQVAGWTFKTKPGDIDEMSVVKGYGAFDCPVLTD